MSIWKKNLTLEQINALCKNTAMEHLDIQFRSKGDDFLEATMPVDSRTTQPMGILHGGMSCVLAESVGSLAGFCATEDGQQVVGCEINASHLRPVSKGLVRARAEAVRIGRTMQVWQINIFDEQNRQCCTSRLTLAVVDKK